MPKKLPPLSFKLKLILAYLYLALISYALIIVIYPFMPDQELDAANPLYDRLITIATSLLLGGLTAWTVYLFHKRSAQAGFAYVLMTLIAYGLTLHLYGWIDTKAESLAGNIFSAVVLVIDIAIVVFLLRSNEARNHLKKR